MAKTKVEIIKVDVNVDFDSELLKRTDIPDALKEKVEEDLRNLKPQPIKKAEREKNEWAPKLEKAFEILEKTLPHEWGQDGPVAASKLLEACESDSIVAVTMRIRGYLKNEKENKWKLQKSKIKGHTYYSLIQYGS